MQKYKYSSNLVHQFFLKFYVMICFQKEVKVSVFFIFRHNFNYGQRTPLSIFLGTKFTFFVFHCFLFLGSFTVRTGDPLLPLLVLGWMGREIRIVFRMGWPKKDCGLLQCLISQPHAGSFAAVSFCFYFCFVYKQNINWSLFCAYF